MKSKIIRALLAALLAVGLWVYVVTTISPNSDKTFPDVQVILQGEAVLGNSNLMVTNKDFPAVTLHLEGNRLDLDSMNSANITLTADVSRISEAGTYEVHFTPSYPGDITQSDIKILDRKPGSITVVVENRISKQVPVIIRYDGTLDENFLADKENVTMDHPNVTITGPESVINKIEGAYVNVNLTDRQESLSEQYQYTLCDQKGKPVDSELVTTDVAAVTVDLRIVRVKEVALVVEIKDGGGATKDTAAIVQEPQTIRISGSDSKLDEIQQLNIGTIDLAETPAEQVIKFPINLPEGVTNETGVTEVSVDVKFPGMETKTLSVTNIQQTDVPENLELELITQVLEVTVRGPKEQVEKITESNISVTASFKKATAGTAAVKAVITVDSDQVGVVGSYNITAALQEKTTEGTENGATG